MSKDMFRLLTYSKCLSVKGSRITLGAYTCFLREEPSNLPHPPPFFLDQLEIRLMWVYIKDTFNS
jgi:hypothetical protein